MLKIGRISARFHISFRSFLILFFIFQVLMLPEAEAQLKQEMNWDTDSSSARMTGRSAALYCSRKGKRLPDMRELADAIHLFSNSSGHWTSYTYPGGSRVFCAYLKSGPVCSDQKENRKAYARCVK